MYLRVLLLLFAAPCWADIAYIASASSDTGVSPDITVSKPTGTLDGHVMIACYGNNDDDATSITSSGWTEIAHEPDANTSSSAIAAFYKVASSEGSSYTFDSDGAAGQTTGAIATFSGVDPTVLDVTYVTGSHYVKRIDDTTPAPRAITTTTDGAWVLVCSHRLNDTTTTAIAPPSGYDERVEELGNNRHMQIATKEVAAAGTETPGDITYTNGNASGDSIILTIALKPVAADKGWIRRRR